MNTVIYVLIDPRTHEARYLGKTSDLNGRFSRHCLDRTRSWKANWIRTLRDSGLRPRMEVVEDLGPNASVADWQDAERFWIAYLRSIGVNLTNLTDGGEGMSGYSPTPETRRKTSETMRGMVRSPEHCAHISEAHLGKVITKEARHKMSMAKIGKPVSPKSLAALLKACRQQVWSKEARRNLSVAMTGKKQSLERRKKSSEVRMGKKASLETRARMSEAQKRRRAIECDNGRLTT